MGNCFSASQRRCGLCYFELDEEAASLGDSSVHRKYTWRKTSSIHDEERTEAADEPLPSPLPEDWREFLRIEIRTKFKVFRASCERGCVGCQVIIKAIESACKDDDVVLDDKSWEEEVQVTWTMPSGHDRDLSNLKMEFTVDIGSRAPQSQGSDYHTWTILIDVDRINGHEKEHNSKFNITVNSYYLKIFTVCRSSICI